MAAPVPTARCVGEGTAAAEISAQYATDNFQPAPVPTDVGVRSSEIEQCNAMLLLAVAPLAERHLGEICPDNVAISLEYSKRNMFPSGVFLGLSEAEDTKSQFSA